MRLVQLRVTDANRQAILDALDALDAEYVVVDEATDLNTTIVQIPVPDGASDGLLAHLDDAGLGDDAYTVVTDATSPREVNQQLADRFVEGPKGDAGVSHPEIRERALDLQPNRPTYVALAALSAVVATAGLLLDSAIIIVGAMVIAPFAGSSLSASVGAVIDDRRMLVQSVNSQLLGLIVGFVSALAVTAGLRQTSFVPSGVAIGRIEQIGLFLTPNLLALTIAVCAGAAGALALATDLPVSIAGVAIAAAIVPSVATAAIGVVWGDALVTFGAVVLLAMNIVFINLTAYLALVGLGYRSSLVRDSWTNFQPSVRTGVYAVLVLVFAVVLAATVGATAQYIVFEHQVKEDVEAVVDGPTYDSLELMSVQAEYNDMNALGRVESVTVTVARSSDDDYPLLAEAIERSISARSGREVTVNVRFLEYQTEERQSETNADELRPRPSVVAGGIGDRVVPRHVLDVA
ncbi:uncharacterized hydrophobic domain-containing protein [Halogranum amylolyticum]|uniref:Uncharacterized hydrophobic domain-containing protein n=1 Tax=Halogranum amylolyticum TaxID=660520 RepID=A0A1H8SYM9_9EURY|nr:DUF389 domain-containing protein [Halogranum amylolyticum]SEO83742.1 uncharacterized hydrophobic domain-containing protein [Halogranum amylolyticum]